MHPADINAALIKKRTNQSAIARAVGVTPMAISQVIHGRSKSFRIAMAISKATGISINALWPGRYMNRGQNAA